MQAVADFWFAAACEGEKPTDFGEGEGDQASVDRRGFQFGLVVGLSAVLPPLFLALCAVTARKV